MVLGTHEIFENKVVLRIKTRICDSSDELLTSPLFRDILKRYLDRLRERESVLLNIFESGKFGPPEIDTLVQTFQFLAKMAGDLVPNVVPGSAGFFRDRALFNDFVENLYNYWRSFDRFILCDASGTDMDQRPSKTFNVTIEQLTNLVRETYRDIEENITGKPPRTYRQIRAGAEIAAIARPHEFRHPGGVYERLQKIPVIRQTLLYPPLILNPPMNKRTGKFERVSRNPLASVEIHEPDWLCYPAKVGPLLIRVYFHKKFFELGFSLCNLFEIADDEDLQRKPDAVYLFGVPGNALDEFGDFPTVFYDDEENGMLAAAVPARNEFGYFGYLKKMILTLHNIQMMKSGRLPYHGAFVRMALKGKREANVLIVGDTGAGKSETLEALRMCGEAWIQDLIVVADDMGSLESKPGGKMTAYGTEIGAFLRLDDLQPGYAFGQIDRTIIMSPNKVNARVVIPVTNFDNVIKGHRVDYVLYANNYEETDGEHPIIERFESAEQALCVFREGMVMSKGTTTTTGIVHSYFANIFGPPQYRQLHDTLAARFFKQFFEEGIFVGQIRTKLGIPGREKTGPEEAAKALLAALIEHRP